MLMSLWERHGCKLFSGVDTDCNLSIDQKKPVHIKCFRCRENQSTNTYKALIVVMGTDIKHKTKNIHNDAPHCGSRAIA